MAKNVLIIMDTMAGGGAEKALVALLRHLVADGYRVALLLFNAVGPHLEAVPGGVEVRHVYSGVKPLRDRLLFHTPWRDTLMARRLRRMLAGARYDVVLSFLEGAAAWLHSLLPREVARRHLTWVHTDFSSHHWSRAFFSHTGHEQAFYDRMDRVVFVSHEARRHFTLRLDDERARVIYNLIDVDDIRRQAQESAPRKHRFTLVFVGRLHPIKRPDRFIDTVALLRREGLDVDAWVVGDGDERHRLERQCREVGVEGHVTFMGFQKNPYPYIARADALVITSDAEGLPLVMLEALALGTPIIATRCDGPAEVLAGGAGTLTGFTPRDLADAVKALHASPSATPAALPAGFAAGDILSRLRALLEE